MDRPALLALVLLLFVVFLVLMALGWGARRRRQRSIPPLPRVPDRRGDERARFDGFYVSTTVANEPLNRIAVRGLGFRSRAAVSVSDVGVVLELRGVDPVFLPTGAIREVRTARVTIDRVVEEGGLVVLAWTIGAGTADAVDVDTYLRFAQSLQLLDAVRGILPTDSRKQA